MMDLPSFLHDLRQEFWTSAFLDGLRIGVMVDGHYDRPYDLAFLMTYCGSPL